MSDSRVRGVRLNATTRHMVRLGAIATCVVLAASGCADGSSPLPRGQAVFVTSSEANELLVLDGSSGRVARRVRLQDAVMLGSFSSDSSQLYLAEGLSSTGPLIALNTTTLQTDWTEAQSTLISPRPNRWDGVAVYAFGALLASRDGTRLYVYPASRSDTLGIASLDASSRDLIAFGGQPLALEANGLALVPTGAGVASDALLAVGQRITAAAPLADSLFWLDPLTLAVRDSAELVDVPGGAPGRLISPVVAPDGHFLYTINESSLRLDKYDLISRMVVDRAPLQTDGLLAVSPDGSAVYLIQRTDDPAAHATLSMYDSNLNLLATIALPDIGHSPAHVADVTTNVDGTRVFVIAGTGSRIPLIGPPQSGHLVAVDPSTRKVVWDTPLNIWAPAQLFVR